MIGEPPKQVQVGPHTYRITTIPDGILEGAGSDGTCTPRHLLIALDDGQPHTQKADTLLHELTHALLATVKLDEDTEETICLALAPALLALMRDNPELIDYLTT